MGKERAAGQMVEGGAPGGGAEVPGPEDDVLSKPKEAVSATWDEREAQIKVTSDEWGRSSPLATSKCKGLGFCSR